jgi:hypothetical protein
MSRSISSEAEDAGHDNYCAVIVTSIWVAVDSSNLGAGHGARGGGFLDMGPVSWLFACLLLWIVAFPCYLVARSKLVAMKAGQATPGPSTGSRSGYRSQFVGACSWSNSQGHYPDRRRSRCAYVRA